MSDYVLAQTGVLGSMLISPACVGEVLTVLRPEDFTDELSRETFRAIRTLFLDGAKIDPVLVLDRLGGPDPAKRDFILSAMDRTPTAANVLEYAKVVREQARLRAIQCVGVELMEQGLTLDQARELSVRLESLLMDRRGVESQSMEDCLLHFYEELDHTPEYLPWGIDFLNEGLTAEQSDYIVLGGYPSDGKTALALFMAYTQAKTKRVAFFSLETKSSKLFSRLFASVAQVSNAHIKRRSLTQEDFTKLADKADEIKLHDLHLIKASSMTVEDIGAYAKARRFDVIYIDYLTLIPAPGKTEYDQATYISKSLHRLAQDSEISVVALSQLSRPDNNPKPTLSSLRSSGQIEQDADVVMFIYREDPKELRSRRILSVAKNKEGPTGSIPLLFDGETQTFRVDTEAASAEVARKFTAIGRKTKAANRAESRQVTFTEINEPDSNLPF